MLPCVLRSIARSLPIFIAAVSAYAQESNPDLLLLRGHIFTSDTTRPWVEALAVRGDRIVAVGSTAELEKLAGTATRTLDLGGRTVIPGLNDAHIHIGLGWPGEDVSTGPNPFADPGRQLTADSLSSAVKRIPAGTWLKIAVGSTILDDSLARRDWLDSIAPDHPVRLRGWSGHGSVFNSRALEMLQLSDSTRDPMGGWFGRDARGRLTGLAHEYAQYMPDIAAGKAMSPAERVSRVRKELDGLAALGLTTIQNMEGTTPEVSAQVFAGDDLPVRVRVISFIHPTPDGRNLDPSLPPTRPERIGPLAYATGVKYILDGTPIERLALMRQAYTDRPGWHGHLNFPVDTIRAILREGLESHTQTTLHAVGDSTIALVLRLMTELAPDSTWRRERLRLEHGDGLAHDLFPLTKRLGIIISQNPSHLMVGPLLAVRYGDTRAKSLQPMRSLFEAGIPLALGSDGPVNPFLNIMFAVAYPDNPSERLTVEQAVWAYTSGSAFAEFKETEKGTLAPGMVADLAVLSQDIFSVPVEALPGTTTVLTLVGGRVVHDAGVVGKR